MAAKVILAGGTGFIGTALARRLREQGHGVVILTRHPPRRRDDGACEVQWDGRGAGPWAAELEGAGGVINLAGSTINTVHNAENRRRILESRVDPVRALGAAARACRQPPAVWVQTSAVGFYGHGERRCTEDAPAGVGFKPEVCLRWEQAFREECPAAVRAVVLRVGVVLGRRGGAYPLLARLAKRFLGGPAGDGRQGISWILLDDLVEIYLRAVEGGAMQGVYNACAPEPVSNADFMRALRASLGRPWAPPVPAFLLRVAAPLVMHTDPGIVLQGQYAIPARLEAEGFRFSARRIGPALRALAG